MADSDKPKLIRIEHIEIKGYKGVDHLRLDFPKPRMEDDPDIFVLGSANGIGKTSVLECCSWLMLALMMIAGKRDSKESMLYGESSLKMIYDTTHLKLELANPLDILIKAGCRKANIDGKIAYGSQKLEIKTSLYRNGAIHFEISKPLLLPEMSKIDVNFFVELICGMTPNPVITQLFLLFHSYRKIKEGGIELGTLLKSERPVNSTNYISRTDTPKSIFKNKILFSLMANANLLETAPAYPTRDENINKLNELMSIYANGGTINKLQPLGDNTLDIRITPQDSGESFSFDGLSSGQKEIISTLFMIWHHTRNNPALVMIDEPELHLNAQWHRSIIRNLLKYTPWNQYIIATHSEDIMNAVNKDRRLFLLPEPQGGDNECTH